MPRPDRHLITRIERTFGPHRPHEGQKATRQLLRDQTRALARRYAVACPPSHELDRALDALDDALSHALAALVRYPPHDPGTTAPGGAAPDPQRKETP